jgi:hypothetical protein
MNINLAQFLQQTLQNEVLRWFFYGPLFLIVLDVITGIGAAITLKKFVWKQVGTFLDKDLRTYVIVSLVVALVYLLGGIAQATALSTGLGMSVLALHISASIWSNVSEIVDVQGLPSTPVEQVLTPVIQPIEQEAQGPIVLPAPARESWSIDQQTTGPAPIIRPLLTLQTKPSPGTSSPQYPEHI